VSAALLEELEPCDYVMVHAGAAIAKISSDDDEEVNQVMEDLKA
jgi:hydrogenase expression/formation protein HypC